MSGESTEKRSILYVSAKIQQSRIMCDWLEKLDATENNAMFGDDDINFDTICSLSDLMWTRGL